MDPIKYKQPKIITATNVFAHVLDLHDFLEGVKLLLADDGVFVIEVQYLMNLEFDSVYHEHNYYYSCKALMKLLGKHDLEIFDLQKISTHAGSIRVFASRLGQHELTQRAHDVLLFDVGCQAVVDQFKQRTLLSKGSLCKILCKIPYDAKIYGIGLPSRAVTLINYFGLGDILDCIVEVDSSPKVGHYCPGTRIPVIAESSIQEEPEMYLLLSWHLGQPFIDKWKRLHPGIPIILPLPEAKIV